MNIPKELFLKIPIDKKITGVAQIEAAMSYLKSQNNKDGQEYVYLYPELVKTKEDSFLFAMVYGMTLAELKNGLRPVPKDIEEMFWDTDQKKT